METSKLLKLAKKHGTPLCIIDHDIIRENCQRFNKALPRVQAYYAVKANSEPEIIRSTTSLTDGVKRRKIFSFGTK
jgi:ornithine decarboxylase